MKFEEIKGFGAKRIAKLNEAGLNGPADLLMIFPVGYACRTSPSEFAGGQMATIVATCVSEPKSSFVRKGLSIVRARFEALGEPVDCIWFNQPFVSRRLVKGREYALTGKIKRNKKSSELYVSMLCDALQGEITPMYRAYNGIPAKVLSDAVKQVLGKVTIEGRISMEFCRTHGILPLNSCIRTLHSPQNFDQLQNARLHAATQILAVNIAEFSVLKGESDKNKAIRYNDNRPILRKVINSLPYKLTADQLSALNDVLIDMDSDRRMNRLIEGDVGCGKTIVSFLAMYFAALSGYQAALMAPTELLARQHYNKAIEFFSPLGISCELLCGSQSKERRAEALFNIENGNASVVIGTHSIFQDAVCFKKLALTIADEQQRFGVEQRGSFENKGFGADSLVMTATPIPRTLALTLYGDLDISIIKTMPCDKPRILTRLVPESKTEDMFEYVFRKISEGEKTYVVCPRVDDENEVSAVDVYKKLRRRFGDVVGLAHGKMKDAEKNKAMDEFAHGKCYILVCTTVVEVGIDVPEAVNMIIFSPDSYGLSQLHQLRGRVGRGKKESYCFLLGGSSERLNYFVKNSDGFSLAEYDFKMRGAGDFLGKRQHGNDSIFAGIGISEQLLNEAKSLSEELIKSGEIKSDKRSFDYIKDLTLN